MSMIFEISTFKLASISSKILDTKEKNVFVELCNDLSLGFNILYENRL